MGKYGNVEMWKCGNVKGFVVAGFGCFSKKKKKMKKKEKFF